MTNLKFFTNWAVACISLMFMVERLSANLAITDEQAENIGLLIWKNECKGTVEGLTSWNQGEEFASMGIGHFIWYPKGRKGAFLQTFPALIAYLIENDVSLPKWLKESQGCPWETRDAFYRDRQDKNMLEIRALLYETRGLQARFMAKRLESALPKMLAGLPEKDQKCVSARFYSVAGEPNGFYVLLDYVNFKGEGISAKEIYNGKGWGLRHVLLGMEDTPGPSPIDDFIRSAKKTLTERVENSPPERNEKRWLKGWLNRLDTYKIRKP